MAFFDPVSIPNKNFIPSKESILFHVQNLVQTERTFWNISFFPLIDLLAQILTELSQDPTPVRLDLFKQALMSIHEMIQEMDILFYRALNETQHENIQEVMEEFIELAKSKIPAFTVLAKYAQLMERVKPVLTADIRTKVDMLNGYISTVYNDTFEILDMVRLNEMAPQASARSVYSTPFNMAVHTRAIPVATPVLSNLHYDNVERPIWAHAYTSKNYKKGKRGFHVKSKATSKATLRTRSLGRKSRTNPRSKSRSNTRSVSSSRPKSV